MHRKEADGAPNRDSIGRCRWATTTGSNVTLEEAKPVLATMTAKTKKREKNKRKKKPKERQNRMVEGMLSNQGTLTNPYLH